MQICTFEALTDFSPDEYETRPFLCSLIKTAPVTTATLLCTPRATLAVTGPKDDVIWRVVLCAKV